jgi:hypothetical protein
MNGPLCWSRCVAIILSATILTATYLARVVNLPEYRLRAMNRDGTVAFYKNAIRGVPAVLGGYSEHSTR